MSLLRVVVHRAQLLPDQAVHMVAPLVEVVLYEVLAERIEPVALRLAQKPSPTRLELVATSQNLP